MRGAVRPMPVPPRPKTPQPSPARDPQGDTEDVKILLHTEPVSPKFNVDDFVNLTDLNDLIEKENEAAQADWSERRRAEEQREADELEAANAESLAEAKRERKRQREEQRR